MVSRDGATLPDGHRGNGAASPTHSVQFYESEDFLSNAVAGYVADGLGGDQPVLVIAAAHRCDSLMDRLVARGIDCEGTRRTGGLTFLDVGELIASFMVGRAVDPVRFKSCMGTLLERSLQGRNGARARVYGEMVDVLCRDGNREAAIHVEQLWNELASTHRFTLLCAYTMNSFEQAEDGAHFHAICGHHGRVLPAESYTPAADEDTRLREISMLQQRASALEAEIAHRLHVEQALRSALAERTHAEEALRRSEQELKDFLENAVEVTRDITERKHTEEALRSAKEEAVRASRAKSEFLAVMSHELRTPLNAILGYQDLLAGEVSGPVTDLQKSHLAGIKNGAERLLELIDHVLRLSRIEAGKEVLTSSQVDLAEIARKCCALVEPMVKRKRLTFDVRLPNAPVLCTSDAGKLHQILLNLLSNAVKFTELGGVVVEVKVGRDRALVDVQDTGVGIHANDLDRIFDPFVQVDASSTRRYCGTGLGLPVSRHLARLLGGGLNVVSMLGSGSTFTLAMPTIQLP